MQKELVLQIGLGGWRREEGSELKRFYEDRN